MVTCTYLYIHFYITFINVMSQLSQKSPTTKTFQVLFHFCSLTSTFTNIEIYRRYQLKKGKKNLLDSNFFSLSSSQKNDLSIYTQQ